MRGTALVAQWSGIHLLMQRTRVQSLVQDDSTCRGAAEPVHLNKRTHPSEKPTHRNWSAAPAPCVQRKSTRSKEDPPQCPRRANGKITAGIPGFKSGAGDMRHTHPERRSQGSGPDLEGVPQRASSGALSTPAASADT